MSGTTLSVAMEDSLLTIHPDGGRSTEPSLAEMSCRCVAADPELPGRAYCGTANDGLWRTDDGGSSWHAVRGNLRHEQVTAVAVSPTERGQDRSRVIYIGTEPSAVFRSTDGGDHWEELATLLHLPSAPTWSFPPRPDTHHVRWIAPDPGVAARLFVAIEAGALVRSEDAGRSWQDRVPSGPIDTHTLVVHPHDSRRLFSAAGDGYFESRDGGTTWQKPEDGLRHRYVWGCIVDHEDPDTVLISASRSAMTAHSARGAESWIYRRSHGGPWEAVQEGLPQAEGSTISSLAVDPYERGVVYAANNRGVFRSPDMGETWHRLDVPWPDRFLKQRVAGLAVGRRPESS
jgi:photosystem II stability/assembly factor-like uncharacterized protein